MGRWLKRIVIAILLVVWFLIMLFPCMAVNLAMRTEMYVGRNARVFLVAEDEGEGIGVEWQRPFSPTNKNQQCTQTAVHYFMWTGQGEDVVYCQCTDLETGEQLPTAPSACKN